MVAETLFPSGFLVSSRLVQCINQPKDERISNPKEDIRVEAAHVIASLAYGTHSVLSSSGF